MTTSTVYLIVSLIVMAVGLLIALWRRNLIKILLGVGIAETGLHLFMVSMGYVPGATAPIVDDANMLANAETLLVKQGAVVDPVVQALVLTAIVIGVGVTAVGLAYAVRINAKYRTLDVKTHGRLRW